MAGANNAESIQSKIQIARRDAEALKDRIKRKKNELAVRTMPNRFRFGVSSNANVKISNANAKKFNTGRHVATCDGRREQLRIDLVKDTWPAVADANNAGAPEMVHKKFEFGLRLYSDGGVMGSVVETACRQSLENGLVLRVTPTV